MFELCCKKKKSEDIVRLRREINIIQGVGILVGVIIGSGIFVSPVGVLLYAKSVGLSLVMWLLSGVFSALGAVVYAELAVTIPKSGGEYVYLLETFGHIPAFMALWITFFVIGSAGSAANTLLFAEYMMKPFYLSCIEPLATKWILAILLNLFLCFLNCYSIPSSIKLNTVLSFSKIVALVLIVGFGISRLASGDTTNFVDIFENSETAPGMIVLSFYQGFWAYQGWNYINFVAGEVKNPARNIPIIIVVSLLLITGIYVLANVAYFAVLSPAEILQYNDGSTAIAVGFAEQTMGAVFWMMPLFVALSVFGGVNSDTIAMSRLGFAASEDGNFPAFMSMLSVTRLTPIPAVCVKIGLQLLFLAAPDIFYLIQLTGFAVIVISTMAVCSLLHIRRVRPELNKSSFKLPLFLPIIFLVINLVIGILTFYQSPVESLIGIGIMLSGLPVYLFGVRWKRKPATILKFMHKINVGIQKVLLVVPTESNEDDSTQKFGINNTSSFSIRTL